jgi:hypothetical protein
MRLLDINEDKLAAIGAICVALIKRPCVCFSAQTGKHLLVLSLTAFDPLRNAYSPKRET